MKTSRTVSNIVRVVCLLVLLSCPAGWGRTIYVDDDTPAAGDGSSWAGAYKYLQDALAAAETAENPVEIRVAQGLYRPDRSAANPEGTGDRAATFGMLSGVALVGGFAGPAGADPNERNVHLYQTILSGDLAGDDVLSEDPQDAVFANTDGYWQHREQWCLVQEFTRRENSLHVVTASGVDQTAVLDGFTITAGNAFKPPYWFGRSSPLIFGAEDEGGGLINEGGSPRLVGCRFIENSAFGSGGALSNSGACNPVLMDCSFMRNEGFWHTGGVGSRDGVHLEMTRCVFEGNTSPHGYDGAALTGSKCTLSLADSSFIRHSGRTAVTNTQCDATFTRCEFANNSSGGMDCSNGDLVLIDCGFVRNSGRGGLVLVRGKVQAGGCHFVANMSSGGGGIYMSGKELTLKNCLFSGNSAAKGGAIYCAGAGSILLVANCTFSLNKAPVGSALAAYSNSTSIEDSIFWDNHASDGSTMRLLDGSAQSILSISHSVLEGGLMAISGDAKSQILWGAGNMGVDPCFARPGYWDANSTAEDSTDDFFVAGDYHLKSQAGRWDTASQSWLPDDVTSPCIDAGDPDSPVGLEPFPNGGRINMGAYGGTAEASKSYFGGPVCETIIAGDINGDGTVDWNDLNILASHWLEDGRKPVAQEDGSSGTSYPAIRR